MSVSGIIQDKDGRYKVMFGNRLYSEGDRLQRFLENQTSLIRVSKVTDKAVEFAWVMDTPGATPRRL